MTPEITICLLICLFTFALYLWNPYKSLGTTALLTYGMFVIAAGFSHTQFVKNIAKLVKHISHGV